VAASNAGSVAAAQTSPTSHVATGGGDGGAQRRARFAQVTGGSVCARLGTHRAPGIPVGLVTMKCAPPPQFPRSSGVHPAPSSCRDGPQPCVHEPSLKSNTAGGVHALSADPHEHEHVAGGALGVAVPSYASVP
jgi:hypothetical protein